MTIIRIFALILILTSFLLESFQSPADEISATEGIIDHEQAHRKLMRDLEAPYYKDLETKREAADPDRLQPALSVFQRLVQDRLSGKAPLQVKKNVVSKNLRLLFVAGLEGTGHHAIRDIFQECFTEKVCVPATMSTDLFHRTRVSHGFFGGADTEVANAHLEIVYARLKALATQSKSMNEDDGQLHILGLEYFPDVGMLSYPNYNDIRTKPLDHPDLVPLAVLAEAAGVDLRILVLNRKALDAVHSTVQRSFGFGHQASIMVDNAQVLLSQLRQLDPKFFLCLDYEDMVNLDQRRRDRLRAFLHPHLDRGLVNKMWQSFRRPNETDSTVTAERHAYLIYRLTMEVERLKRVCPAW